MQRYHPLSKDSLSSSHQILLFPKLTCQNQLEVLFDHQRRFEALLLTIPNLTGINAVSSNNYGSDYYHKYESYRKMCLFWIEFGLELNGTCLNKSWVPNVKWTRFAMYFHKGILYCLEIPSNKRKLLPRIPNFFWLLTMSISPLAGQVP